MENNTNSEQQFQEMYGLAIPNKSENSKMKEKIEVLKDALI